LRYTILHNSKVQPRSEQQKRRATANSLFSAFSNELSHCPDRTCYTGSNQERCVACGSCASFTCTMMMSMLWPLRRQRPPFSTPLLQHAWHNRGPQQASHLYLSHGACSSLISILTIASNRSNFNIAQKLRTDHLSLVRS
jgi:hypothetical protein